MRMILSESLRDRDFARQTFDDLHLPALRSLTALFTAWHVAGDAEIDDPAAAAKLFLSIVTGDAPLSLLIGIEEELLDGDAIAWRLRGFLDQLRIA